MMRSLFCSFVLGSSLLTATAFAADGSACKDMVIVLSDENPNPAPGVVQPRITLALDCHSASGAFPEATTTNYYVYSKGKFCQGSRVCGNISAWRGSMKVGAKWYFDTQLNPSWGGYNNVNTGNPTTNDPNSWWNDPIFVNQQDLALCAIEA